MFKNWNFFQIGDQVNRFFFLKMADAYHFLKKIGLSAMNEKLKICF